MRVQIQTTQQFSALTMFLATRQRGILHVVPPASMGVPTFATFMPDSGEPVTLSVTEEALDEDLYVVKARGEEYSFTFMGPRLVAEHIGLRNRTMQERRLDLRVRLYTECNTVVARLRAGDVAQFTRSWHVVQSTPALDGEVVQTRPPQSSKQAANAVLWIVRFNQDGSPWLDRAGEAPQALYSVPQARKFIRLDQPVRFAGSDCPWSFAQVSRDNVQFTPVQAREVS